MVLPPRVKTTLEQLGLGQKDPRELFLPDGLEAVGDHWFQESYIEKLVVSSGVRRLGVCAFALCT